MKMLHSVGMAGLMLMGCAAEVGDASWPPTPQDAGEPDSGLEWRGDAGSPAMDDVDDGDSQDPGDADVRVDDGGEDSAAVETWSPGDRPVGEGPFWPGTGRREYVASHFDDTVSWEAGVQGGYHIWVAAQVDRSILDALDEEARREIRHTYTFVHEDGELLASASRTGGFRFHEEQGGWQATGLYAVLQAPRRPSTMNDEYVRYQLEVQLGDEVFQREVWLMSACCD